MKSETKQTIDEIIKVLKTTSLDKKTLFQSVKDLYSLLIVYLEENTSDACRYFTNILIPFLQKVLMVETNEERSQKYYEMYKNSHGFAARRSLEHFILYYEWDWEQKDKLLENRYEILMPFVYYLNKMTFDENLQYVLASYMPSAGKSRCTCYYEAWRLGVQSGGCFLRISYSDLLAKGFSRSVIDIIKSEEYAFVFPHLNYKKNKKKLFTKETDEEWRLSTAKLLQSYMARSRDGQINGTRASLSIDIDDMLKDDKEALNMDLHKDIWIKWVNVIQSRRTLGKKIGYVIVGTKWSPYDLICRVSQDLKETHDFKDDPKFKYTEIAKDGTAVIINVPALDYETDESTCPKVISTEELHEIRRKNTPYYFQSVYQQNPIPPEGLDFAYEALNTYDVVPRMGNPREEGRYDYTLASLDPARKGKNYVSMPIHCRMGELYPLVDVLFEKKAMSDLYEDIVAKIIQHKVIRLVLENNIDTSLKKILDDMLHERGYYSCEIIEHYSLGKKEDRIRDQQGVIRNQIVFPRKGLFPVNTPMGKFMDQLTTFSFDFPNKYDDAIDSEAMFAHQIILDRASGQKAQVLSRRKLGL